MGVAAAIIGLIITYYFSRKSHRSQLQAMVFGELIICVELITKDIYTFKDAAYENAITYKNSGEENGRAWAHYGQYTQLSNELNSISIELLNISKKFESKKISISDLEEYNNIFKEIRFIISRDISLSNFLKSHTYSADAVMLEADASTMIYGLHPTFDKINAMKKLLRL